MRKNFKEVKEVVSLEKVYENMYDEVITEMTLDMCINTEKLDTLIERKFEKYGSQIDEAMRRIEDSDRINQIVNNSLINFEEGIYRKFEKELGIEIPRRGI